MAVIRRKNSIFSGPKFPQKLDGFRLWLKGKLSICRNLSPHRQKGIKKRTTTASKLYFWARVNRFTLWYIKSDSGAWLRTVLTEFRLNFWSRELFKYCGLFQCRDEFGSEWFRSCFEDLAWQTLAILQPDQVVLSTKLLFKLDVSLPLVTGELLQKTVDVTNVTYRLCNIKI